MGKEQFLAVMPYISADLISMIAKKKQVTEDEAIAMLYASKLYAALEQELLEKINALDIGPQGFGGQTTALGVNIETYATHIAGLPVAVNVGCHVTRHATKEL
mgnify:FL=1